MASNMHINDPVDATTAPIVRPHTADFSSYRITSSRRRSRLSNRSSTTSSSAAATSDRDSFTTALDAFARPQSASGLRGASLDELRPRMGSTTTITAAAAAQAASAGNWPGGIIRETDIQVESRELAGLDAELRRRSKYLPREDGGWVTGNEHEALRDLANFLRDVTPPPGNYMSVRTPTSPSATPSVASSSLRRRKSRKASTLKRFVGVFMRRSNGKMKMSRRRSNSSLNSVSRPPSIRRKRWPSRIRLPDTAVAGTTVEGHRHIAISIPLEYAHIGPEPRYRFPKRDKGRRSRSMAETVPQIYNDIKIRPLSALVSEPHVGTQLGPVAEERESLSSKTPSWENPSLASASGVGNLHNSAEVRKVRLASRNTFGTVHEEFGDASRPNSASNSRPVTRSGSSSAQTPPTPPRRSSSGEYNRPRTPTSSGRSSDEGVRRSAHRMGALAALTSPNSRPSSSSAHSLRSFASASPGGTTGRIYYPKRNSSLQPPSGPNTPSENGGGKSSRGRGRAGQGQGTQQSQQRPHSRDSSRDQYTLQESIFSEPSYLESSHTIDSGGAAPGPVVSRGAGRDRTPSRKGNEREVLPSSSSGRRSARNSRDGKRWSAGSGAGLLDDGVKKTNKQSPSAGKVLTASKSSGSLRGSSGEAHESSTEVARASVPRPQCKTSGLATQGETGEDRSPPRVDITVASPDKPKQTMLLASPELIAGQIPNSRKREEGKGKSPRDGSPKSLNRLQTKEQQQSTPDKPVSPIPSPKERRERRKTVLLSRKQRIAELRRTLERPETTPSDLLWDRRLSSSSEESEAATPMASPPSSPWRNRRPLSPRGQRRRPATLPAYLSFTPVVTVADVRPESPVGSASEGSVESSPQRASGDLQPRESATLSLSSPTTVATMIRTSPVPPYQALGSVTPPQSPSNWPATPSPSSEVHQQHDDRRSHTTNSSLRPQPPLKRLSSVRRGASLGGRSSPVTGGRPASPARDGTTVAASSPPRPKTAGKGEIVGSRRKDYFSGVSFAQDQAHPPPMPPSRFSSDTPSPTTSSSSQNRADAAEGVGKPKSALKMTRSELFERYEAMRDQQARDLERRLRRVERHGEYWLTSMLPLLTDLSQTLGQLALGGSERQSHQHHHQEGVDKKGKGRAVMDEEDDDVDDERDDQVRGAIYADGRKSRFGVRSTPAVNEVGFSEPFSSERPSTASFEASESVYRRWRSHSSNPGRVYLHDGSEGSHHPGIGNRVRVENHHAAGHEADHKGRRHTPNRNHSGQASSSARSTPSRKQQQQHQLQLHHPATSGSTTMVDNASVNNNNGARANSMGTIPGSFRTMHARSSSSLHDEYRKGAKRDRDLSMPAYALHANTPLSLSSNQLLNDQVAAETERLARLERLNDQIDAQMRALPGSHGPPPLPYALGRKRSEASLETYRGTTTEEEDEGDEGEEGEAGSEIRNADLDAFPQPISSKEVGRQSHNKQPKQQQQQKQTLMGSIGRMFGVGGHKERNTGMDTVTPLMRELQANGSRVSLESEGSCVEGDQEVSALRRGPEPRSVVGFGAFRRR